MVEEDQRDKNESMLKDSYMREREMKDGGGREHASQAEKVKINDEEERERERG